MGTGSTGSASGGTGVLIPKHASHDPLWDFRYVLDDKTAMLSPRYFHLYMLLSVS